MSAAEAAATSTAHATATTATHVASATAATHVASTSTAAMTAASTSMASEGWNRRHGESSNHRTQQQLAASFPEHDTSPFFGYVVRDESGIRP